MDIKKELTETYIITELDELDLVTLYVTNYKPGKGKLVIECFGETWVCCFSAMGCSSIQEFILRSDNDYLLRKLLKETYETDFDKINKEAQKRGFDICAYSDIEIAMQADEMRECFGDDWQMNLPMCNTVEYHYVSKILDAIKEALQQN
ncbi:hypothetical protein [Candidatus Macondimonas diazotrophica]|uniref:Uncharacterized protein n=1 Tax=Candidatus Macondimonas diazotrophica TaxID=2305248 RepID=A0A4Z0F6Z7_9GAMM|nr:hypothetical protein [Candidatus Macondimonas diazotrophica]TFZ81463.1 hypothetical protein E4680_12345 [Candidatus Macondimonas diazotrophica]